MSHELRTPLSAVLGWTHVLLSSQSLTSDAVKGLTVIERNARAQTKIIEDLLDMSSIVSGKVRLDVQTVDLASVINATVETIRPGLQAKGIDLQLMLDAKADLVHRRSQSSPAGFVEPAHQRREIHPEGRPDRD